MEGGSDHPALVVHVGLPKTGTTTLQTDVFPQVNGTYLGVRQPRKQHQSTVYDELLRLVRSIEAPPTRAVADLMRELNRFVIKSQGPAVISDEMITVGAGWQRQLNRLADILADIKYVVLVTWRNPVEASFSYYCELFRTLDHEPPLKAITMRPEFKIYWAEHLTDSLEESFGRERVVVAQFENIFKGEPTALSDALSLAGMRCPVDLTLGRHNASSSDGSEVTRKVPAPPRSIPTPKLLGPLRSTAFAFRLRSIENRLRRFGPERTETYRVPVLEDADRRDLEQLLMPQTAALARFTGWMPAAQKMGD